MRVPAEPHHKRLLSTDLQGERTLPASILGGTVGNGSKGSYAVERPSGVGFRRARRLYLREWDDPPEKLALLYDLERVAQLLRDGTEPFHPDRDRLAFARYLIDLGCQPPRAN
jgi:hypothetical protein